MPRSRRVQAALKGKTIGVQVSTTHANFAGKYLKDIATVKEYKTTDDRDLDLKSGRIDASLDDFRPMMATASKAGRIKDFAIVGPKLIGGVFGVGEGMGLRKSDADLTAKFDKALAAAIADGTVQEAYRAVVQGRYDSPLVRRARFRELRDAPVSTESGASR